jgi:hypothetical protein
VDLLEFLFDLVADGPSLGWGWRWVMPPLAGLILGVASLLLYPELLMEPGLALPLPLLSGAAFWLLGGRMPAFFQGLLFGAAFVAVRWLDAA